MWKVSLLTLTATLFAGLTAVQCQFIFVLELIRLSNTSQQVLSGKPTSKSLLLYMQCLFISNTRARIAAYM